MGYDRQKEIIKSVSFKGAVEIHASILKDVGLGNFDRDRLVDSEEKKEWKKHGYTILYYTIVLYYTILYYTIVLHYPLFYTGGFYDR